MDEQRQLFDNSLFLDLFLNKTWLKCLNRFFYMTLQYNPISISPLFHVRHFDFKLRLVNRLWPNMKLLEVIMYVISS